MTHTGAEITEADAKTFATKLEKAIESGNQSEADHLIRYPEIAEHGAKSLDSPDELIQGLKKGTTQSSLGGTIIQQIKNGGSYKLLRIRTDSGRPTPLFRVVAQVLV